MTNWNVTDFGDVSANEVGSTFSMLIFLPTGNSQPIADQLASCVARALAIMVSITSAVKFGIAGEETSPSEFPAAASSLLVLPVPLMF